MDPKSFSKLREVHPDLQRLFIEVWDARQDWIITCGLRSAEEQERMFREGRSKIRSGGRHESGHAIDVGLIRDGKYVQAFEPYIDFANTVKRIAAEIGVPIKWGGDWKTFKDGVHFELPVELYPATRRT